MSGDSVRRRTFLPELTEAIDESVTRRYSAAASMIMALIDTTFLIDLMKEAKKSIAGSATIKLDDLIQRREALRIVEQALQPFDVVAMTTVSSMTLNGSHDDNSFAGR